MIVFKSALFCSERSPFFLEAQFVFCGLKETFGISMAYGSFILCLFGPSLACFDLLDKWVALDKSEAE